MNSGHKAAAVLVVGGGPVGLAAAHLLGSFGVRTVLVERNTATSDEAKAISLDDESLRTFQLCGLAEEIAPVIVPGTGTRYFGVGGRPLLHARGTVRFQFGHAFKNQFAQPELERVLLRGLEKRPEVEVRFATELIEYRQDADGVDALVKDADGEHRLRVDYLLGCDGGRSTVRQQAAIPMTGKRYPDVWLVADTLDDPHDERFGMHYGDPRRPHVVIPGRGGRCRYEFLLHDGEGEPGDDPSFELIRRLLRPFREITPDQVERAVNYRFNAVVADRWRDRRVFLLGDAAHMMPPFAGQGLNSGIRDAANLCWKLARVLEGVAGDELLETYERERLPHARATVRLSVLLRNVVMTTRMSAAVLRDLVIRAAMLTPAGRSYFTGMRYRPSPALAAGLVVGAPHAESCDLLGRALEQPRVLLPDGHSTASLDDLIGSGFAILGVDVDARAWARVQASPLAGLGAVELDILTGDRLPRADADRPGAADVDGRLHRLFGPVRGRFVVVRPDRYVCAVLTPDQAAGAGREIERLLGRP
ncbi:MAG TPA: FAD-dependent monooxygenase [Actinospica sp.]|nr:FAD-dependent monooxygenase [Actinospica sp.]